MNYVDAVVVPVPKRKLAAYRSLARLSGKSGASTAPSSTTSARPTT